MHSTLVGCVAQAVAPDFTLPIVMITAEQITPDLEYFGATTPYLLGDGSVSTVYDMLGKGMHEGLPGHGFVLIDEDGVRQWKGEHPSLWLAPDDLLGHIAKHL